MENLNLIHSSISERELVSIYAGKLLKKSIGLTIFLNLLIITMILFFTVKVDDFHKSISINRGFYKEKEFKNNFRILQNVKEKHKKNNNKDNITSINSEEITNISGSDLDDYTKRQIIDDLINHSYTGRWKSKEGLPNFDHREGMVKVFFQNYLNRAFKGSYYNFLILLHDGEDKSRWLIVQNSLPLSLRNNHTASIELTADHNSTVISNYNINVLITEMEVFNIISKKSNISDFSLSYQSDIVGNNIQKDDGLTGSLSLFNNQYFISITISGDKKSIYHTIANFSLFICCIAAVQMFDSKWIMEKFAESETSAVKYSPIIFLINILWNSFICFINFFFSLLDDRLFNDFVVPAIIYFMTFSYFELRIVFHIWRAQIFRQVNGDAALQISAFKMKLVKFYFLFYGSMVLIYLYGVQVFFWKSFNYIMVGITWLPQIWLNCKRGRRNKIHFGTVLIISLNKIFIPIYFHMCPNNFLNIPIDYAFSITLICLMFAQVVILLLQRIFGMRCLTPKFILPKRFNYGKSLSDLKKMNIDIENLTCSICLGAFVNREDRVNTSTRDIVNIVGNPNNPNQNDLNSTKTEQDIQAVDRLGGDIGLQSLSLTVRIRRRFSKWRGSCKDFFTQCIRKCDAENNIDDKFMFTPCKHLFHTECLKAWIELKNTCPECRRILPVDFGEANPIVPRAILPI